MSQACEKAEFCTPVLDLYSIPKFFQTEHKIYNDLFANCFFLKKKINK